MIIILGHFLQEPRLVARVVEAYVEPKSKNTDTFKGAYFARCFVLTCKVVILGRGGGVNLYAKPCTCDKSRHWYFQIGGVNSIPPEIRYVSIFEVTSDMVEYNNRLSITVFN